MTHLPVTLCHKTRVTKDKKEPCRDASPNAYMMPLCNVIAAQEKTQINSDDKTGECHGADVPQTKHLSSRSLRTRTTPCNKIEDNK